MHLHVSIILCMLFYFYKKLPLSTYLALGIHSKKWLRAILTTACTIYVMIIIAAFMFPVTKTDVNFKI